MINRLKSWTRAFFGISTRETNGLLLLLPLLLLSVFIIPALHAWRSQKPQDFTAAQKHLDSLLAHWPQPTDSTAKTRTFARFLFDPNTVTLAQMDSLGFPTSLASRIYNYRNKNGRFLIKSDLLKIYGMDSVRYADLQAYILLPEQLPSKPVQENYIRHKNNPAVAAMYDLNKADSSQLVKIYGIGTKLSTRIVNYRDKLGGYVSMKQLYEVYGLDSAVINRLHQTFFVNTDFQPVLLNLNTASEKELACHPYISNSLSKAITHYRFQHGNFKSVEDIRKIALVDDAFYIKILPYLSLNP